MSIIILAVEVCGVIGREGMLDMRFCIPREVSNYLSVIFGTFEVAYRQQYSVFSKS